MAQDATKKISIPRELRDLRDRLAKVCTPEEMANVDKFVAGRDKSRLKKMVADKKA